MIGFIKTSDDEILKFNKKILNLILEEKKINHQKRIYCNCYQDFYNFLNY